MIVTQIRIYTRAINFRVWNKNEKEIGVCVQREKLTNSNIEMMENNESDDYYPSN